MKRDTFCVRVATPPVPPCSKRVRQSCTLRLVSPNLAATVTAVHPCSSNHSATNSRRCAAHPCLLMQQCIHQTTNPEKTDPGVGISILNHLFLAPLEAFEVAFDDLADLAGVAFFGQFGDGGGGGHEAEVAF